MRIRVSEAALLCLQMELLSVLVSTLMLHLKREVDAVANASHALRVLHVWRR
jgi:hypothetical protein